MVDHTDADHTSLVAFNNLWRNHFAGDSVLVFSTGRSPSKYKQLKRDTPLLTPDLLMLSVGTEILLCGEHGRPDPSWVAILDEGWDRAAVVDITRGFPELKMQEESEQRPHKVSFHICPEDAERVMPQLEARLREKGLAAKLVYSGSLDLDVMPTAAGKGQALAFIMRKLKEEGRAPLAGTLVCGDSGNDAELFTVEGVSGGMVGNAMDELVAFVDKHPQLPIFKSQKRCAAAIVDAMEHFGMLPDSLLDIDQRRQNNAIAIEVLQNTAGLTAQAVKDIAAKPAPAGLAGDAPPITTWADMQHTTSTTSAVAAQLQRQTLDLREEAELAKRSLNVIVKNLKMEEGENSEKLARAFEREILDRMGLTGEIELAAHRLPRARGKAGPPPLLLTFKTPADKIAFLRRHKRLEKTLFTLDDDLTLAQQQRRRELWPTYLQLRQTKAGQPVYWKGAAIYVGHKPWQATPSTTAAPATPDAPA
eukprot:jgi/Mesvir1/24739/Mv22002-RA.1